MTLLKRLKTSAMGSTVTAPKTKGREMRRLTELNWLSFRPRLRCVTLPSGLMRSCGVFASAPVAVRDYGWADRYCQLAFTVMSPGALQRT